MAPGACCLALVFKETEWVRASGILLTSSNICVSFFARWMDDLYIMVATKINIESKMKAVQKLSLRKQADNRRNDLISSLLDIYPSAGLKLKEEDENIFVGLSVHEVDGRVRLQQHFKQWEPQESRRFKNAGGNVRRSTLLATVCGQLRGALDRCMYGDVVESLVLVLGCLHSCGFKRGLCKMGAEKLLRMHGYLRREVEEAFTRVFG